MLSGVHDSVPRKGKRLQIVAWLMILLGVIYVVSVPRLLYLATTPEITQDKDAADTIQGLRIGAASCAVLAVPTLLGGIKLVQRKRWAYWLVIANLGFYVGGLTVGSIIAFSEERESLWVLLVFLVVFIFALLPATRRELDPQSSAPSA